MRRHWRNFGLFLGPAVAAAIAFGPTPEGLEVAGQRALAVVALCVVWWLFTPVALPVTALVGLGALPVLGVLEPGDAFQLFGNQAVFFVVGGIAPRRPTCTPLPFALCAPSFLSSLFFAAPTETRSRPAARSVRRRQMLLRSLSRRPRD